MKMMHEHQFRHPLKRNLGQQIKLRAHRTRKTETQILLSGPLSDGPKPSCSMVLSNETEKVEIWYN